MSDQVNTCPGQKLESHPCEPRGCPTPGACSASEGMRANEFEQQLAKEQEINRLVKQSVLWASSRIDELKTELAAERDRREKAEDALAFYAKEWHQPDGLSTPNPRSSTPTQALLNDAGLWAAGVLTDPDNAAISAPAQQKEAEA